MGVRPPRIGVVHRATGQTSLAPFIRADGRSPVRGQTRVELAGDEERFSVHFHCSDDDAWGTYTERDAPLWQQEVVELFLAAGEAVPARYFEFEVSPAGVLFDALVGNPHGDRIGLTFGFTEGMSLS
mgnify:FL=1